MKKIITLALLMLPKLTNAQAYYMHEAAEEAGEPGLWIPAMAIFFGIVWIIEKIRNKDDHNDNQRRDEYDYHNYDDTNLYD